MQETREVASNEIRNFVSGKVCRLQTSYLSVSDKSTGARRLSALRHAIVKEPGSSADIWDIEIGGLRADLVGKDDRPSSAERAVHGALTLYAFHQQSKSNPMHVSGREHGLGCAMRDLVQQDQNHYRNRAEEELPRRFAALVTAESMPEMLHYLRQLIQQLRSAGIPLDYGLLAADLYRLQNPYQADSVRRGWGRGFAYRRKPASAEDNQS